MRNAGERLWGVQGIKICSSDKDHLRYLPDQKASNSKQLVLFKELKDDRSWCAVSIVHSPLIFVWQVQYHCAEAYQ